MQIQARIRTFSSAAAQWALVAAATLALTGQGFADDLAPCQAATPQFPQACPCVIARSRAAGIDGPTLSRLVVNDTTGVPIDVFQRYGAVYVQCIQDAVLAGPAGVAVPGVAPLPPTDPPAPFPAPPPAAPPAATAPVAAVPPRPTLPPPFVLSPAPAAPTAEIAPMPGGVPDDLPSLRLADGQALGQWGGIVIDHAFGGRLIKGTTEGGGHLVAARCDFDRSILLLVGSAQADATPTVEVTALAGSGAVIARRVVPGLSYNGGWIAMPLFADIEAGIRRGAALRLAVQGGPVLQFGLGGSNAALGPGRCGADRLRFDSYLLEDYDRPDGLWRAVAGASGPRPAPILEHDAQAPFVPSIALSCDRRLILRSPVAGYGGPGEIVLTPGATRLPLDWQTTAGMLATGPLPADHIAAMAAAGAMTLTVFLDAEPGEGTTFTYPMAGFAEGLTGLACPPPPPAPAAQARTDLTGLGLTWLPGDIGPALPPGADGRPVRAPVATLAGPAGVPTLTLGCDGVPFFAAGDWDIIDGALRLTIDGDPALTFDQTYGTYRAFLNPGGFPMHLAPRLLDGGTLRVMSLDNPGLDVLFPLDGLPRALREAGC